MPENRCSTRYPLVLVHGTGFREQKRVSYWGRIPDALRAADARVFFSQHDAWGNIEDCAQDLKIAVETALRETGAAKVNLIAHSKGGLDARYMICRLGMAERVASLTTISTPHHGSHTMEGLLKLPHFLFRGIALPVNAWFRLLGDKKPDFYGSVCQFTASACAEFNDKNPNVPEVYYQSYTAQMKNSRSDFLMCIPHLVVRLAEGENDGLVPVESARWGEFRGVLTAAKTRGVSHPDVVDLRRRDCPGFDVREFYLRVAEELKQKGL